jgi:protocatechuate 3,4-dioxygenase beta subunit
MPPPRDPRAAVPQTGTGALSGRVVESTQGTPLRRAQVTLVSAEGGQFRRTTTADGEGRYAFTDLPAGRFTLTATKTGYVTLQYGQRRPFEAGTPITLTEGQREDNMNFSLPRGSVIVVRVTDDFGEPLAGAQVQVQRYQYAQDGQRRLSVVPGSTFGLAFTDDRGEFRAHSLMPGEYVVSASFRSLGVQPVGNSSDSSEGFSPTYYPGTVSPAEAQAVSVAVGQEALVQFGLIAARLVRVSGTVVDSEGRPAAGAQLQMVTRQGTSMSMSSAGVVAPDGSFTISGVSPGEHSIDIRPRPRSDGGPGEAASMPIVVAGADITGLRITTSRGSEISGRVIFEGTSPRTTGTTPPRVMAQPADSSRFTAVFPLGDALANGMLDDTNNFRLAGASGRVFLSVSAPPGWIVKSITSEGEDLTDRLIDLDGRASLADVVIRMTDKLTTVAGKVTNSRGQAVRDYVAVILPAEADLEPVAAARRIRAVRPDTNGRYETRGLRPGRYVVTAIEALEQGRQFAPEFQEQLRRSAREFSVREAETATVDLELTEGL